MATSSNVWAMNNDGWEDGLKNVFEPRKLADEEFKRGQGIIKDAYAIDEQQALLPTKLAESMVNRRKAEANLQYYEENPNALVDAIGSEFDKTKVVNQNLIGEAQDKINARTEQQARDELIASKSVITTPEQLNPDGSVRVPATERPTTEIERLELAATAAPTYKMQQDISAMVKTKYTDVVNQAVAQEDYVGAHEAAKKAGIITGDAKLTRLSDDTYTIQTTYGGTRTIGKKALQQMFVTQAVREKMLAQDNEAAGRVELEQQRRITSELDNATKRYVVNAQGATSREVANINAARTIGAAEIRYGGTAQGGQSSGEAAFSRGGVAPKFATKEGVTAKNLDNNFATTLNEIASILPDMVVTSADRKAGEAGKLGANSLHTDGRAADLRVTPQTTAFIKSEFGKNYFAQKGITVVEETSKEAMAKHGSTGPHYHLEYKGNAQQQSQPSASPIQVSGYAATRIKSLTENIPATEQSAFENYLKTLPPEQQRVLQFQGKEINADQKIGEIVNGYTAQRGKTAQPATQAPAMPQSTAPAMPQQVAATEPNVKAAGMPDLPASQSAPRQPETLKDFISGLSLSEIRAMQDDIATVEKTTGATPQSREAKQLLAAAATGENLKYAAKASATGLATGAKQTLESAGIVGTAYDYLVNSYKESVKRGEEYDAKQKKASLDFLKGLQELQQARKK